MFASETAAAVAGGVTTIFEMPVSNPACSTPEVFLQRRALAQRDASVNFALYSGAALSAMAAEQMAAEGAIAFKLFTITPDAAAKGRLPLGFAVALITSAPARVFGLYPGKGCIAPGADADLALVSLDDVFRPDPASLVTRAAHCGIVFADMALRARVRSTIVNGRVVYADGELVSPPCGRFTPGSAAAALEPV
jgi:dihydroorotase-like cyclic amidohydrolase